MLPTKVAVNRVGDKCLRVVSVSTEADDAVNWNNAVQLCRSGPGLYPTLASIQSLLETGNAKSENGESGYIFLLCAFA